MTLYMARYGELFLKSEYVKREFEDRLVANMRAGIPDAKIEKKRGRIFVECGDGKTLGMIFGIVSFSQVLKTEPEMGKMAEAVIPLVNPGTFALRVNRPFKGYPMTSQEIAVELGSRVVEAKGNKVSLSKPDQEIFVELFEDAAYIFTESVPGPGGLPLGTGGRLLLLNRDKDSERAGWMMMKRGCTLDILGGKSPFLEQWSIGQKVNYTEGDLEGAMKNYPALVTGDRGMPSEKREYPLFQPLMGVFA